MSSWPKTGFGGIPRAPLNDFGAISKAFSDSFFINLLFFANAPCGLAIGLWTCNSREFRPFSPVFGSFELFGSSMGSLQSAITTTCQWVWGLKKGPNTHLGIEARDAVYWGLIIGGCSQMNTPTMKTAYLDTLTYCHSHSRSRTAHYWAC